MRNFIFLFLLLNLCSITSWTQSFQVGHKQQTFVDASRANRNVTAEIYYPALIAGDNVSIASGQFPVLIFGHGFVMVWSAYASIWNTLVPNGYIMVFPTTEASFSPSHANFGKDIAYLVGAMKIEGTNASSTFFGAVANTSAAMGHSMGGGSAFLSIQYDTSITVLATLAAANTDPSSISAAKDISIPSIVFAGANDCVTPPLQHQLPMYNALSSSCKSYISITGASHCQFANTNIFCSIGESTCSPQPTINPATQQTTTYNLLLPWLNFYLKNDKAAGVQFQNLVMDGSGITSDQNCLLTTSNVTEVGSQSPINIFPNPFSATTTLEINVFLKNGTFTIFDMYGRTVLELNNVSGKKFEISRDNISNGLYFVQLSVGNKIIGINKLVVTD